MIPFSRRNGYNVKDINIECASDVLKRRIVAAFYKKEFDTYDTVEWTEYTTGIEDMMIEMGITYEFPSNDIIKRKNATALQSYILDSKREWYVIFDFIERYLKICDDKKSFEMSNLFNEILREEVSAYRIVDKLVVPVTNEAELEALSESINVPYDAVSTHITKALELFANRSAPDYENSIKESISAVESMCCIITGTSGANATLGNALKKLKEKGVHIHRAMEKAFSSLYGYTSDEAGIRHGGIDFTNAPPEDAKFMLIACSAFVNYLVDKWSQISQS